MPVQSFQRSQQLGNLCSTPSVWRNRDFQRQPIPFRQLKVLKVLPYMEAKSASLQLPPTELSSALEGHTKQVCIKHRTSTNCVAVTIQYCSTQRRESKMTRIANPRAKEKDDTIGRNRFLACTSWGEKMRSVLEKQSLKRR